MGLGGILFNPNGRILPGEFMRGFVIVLIIGIALQVASVFVSPAIGFVSLVLIWCYFVLYGKRFHDAGMSAWLVLVVFVGYAILSYALTLVLTPILAADAAEMQRQLNEQAAAGTAGFGDIMAASQDIARAQLPASIATALISAAILGGGMMLLKTEPRENKHGPVPGSNPQADTFS